MPPPSVSVLDRAAAASRSDSGTSSGLDPLLGELPEHGGPTWVVAVGLQDPTLVRALQQRLGRLLLVQANSRLAERLSDEWPAGLPAGVRLCTEPVGAAAEDVSWYRYNDPRLDGPLAPAELSPRYRNLTLLGEERRQQRLLADLVEEWWREQGEPAGDGVLLLQGRDPAPALEGALALLPRLERLVLWQESGGRRMPAAVPQPLATRLTQACFQAREAECSCWLRDERLQLRRELAERDALLQQQSRSLQARTLQVEELAESGRALAAQRDALVAETQELLAQRSSLEEECQALAQERDEQQRQNDALSLQQEGLRAALEALAMEREADLRTRDELERLRDLALQERKILQAAHDVAVDQRDGLDAERVSLAVRCRDLQGTLEQLERELAERTQERDSFHAAHDLAVVQRDELDAQRSLLEEACRSHEQCQEDLHRRLDSLETERHVLWQERDDLRERIKRLSSTHAEAEQLLNQWQAERAELNESLVEIQRERHGLWVLRDSLNLQNRSLSERIEALEGSNAALASERQAFSEEGDRLRGEIEVLADRCCEQEEILREREERQGGLAAEVEQLREALTQTEEERDAFHVAHDLAVRQVQELGEQLQTLREEAAQQRRSEAEQRQAETEQRQAEAADLLAENVRLQAEVSALQERQMELQRLTADSERQLALIRDLFVQVSTARSQSSA